MSLRINGVEWSFRTIHGRQFVSGQEYVAVVHADIRAVTISDSVPLEQQLESTARAAVGIRHSHALTACARGWQAEDFDRNQAARRRRASA